MVIDSNKYRVTLLLVLLLFHHCLLDQTIVERELEGKGRGN